MIFHEMLRLTFPIEEGIPGDVMVTMLDHERNGKTEIRTSLLRSHSLVG